MIRPLLEARAEIQKIFSFFFGSNENFKICFRDLLAFIIHWHTIYYTSNHDKYELHMHGNMIFVVYFFIFFGRACRGIITNHRNLISVDDSLRAVIQKFPSSYESIFQMSKFSTKWLDIGSIQLGEGRPIEVPKKVNTSVALHS